MNYHEIYVKVMPPKKEKEERFNIFAHWIGRPISILLTIPLINTTVTPTLVTAWSIVFALLGFFMVSFGNTLLIMCVGWLCFFMWNLLDGVDGNLARCTNQCSALGDLWDTTAGYTAMVLTYFSAGLAAFYNMQSYDIYEPYWSIVLGGATATISIFPRLVMHKKKSSALSDVAIKELSEKESFGLKNIIAMNIISPSGFMQFLFLMCIIFKVINIFVLVYFIINFIVMVCSLYKLLRD